MESFYNHLNAHIQPAWFYLSASPYNLFPTLSTFVHSRFPHGQLLLREMSWQELDSFIFSLTVGRFVIRFASSFSLYCCVPTVSEKMKESNLMTNLPKRKWVFIGDSTQKDPESYAATYRRHPEKVKRIWIRVVRGVNEKEEVALNAEKRWEEAFRGVPREVWTLFEEPGDRRTGGGEVGQIL